MNKTKTFSKIISLIAITTMALSSSCNHGTKQIKHKIMNNRVYVCTGSTAKRYHSIVDCKGLSKCSGEIIELTVAEAEDYEKTPCKMCVE